MDWKVFWSKFIIFFIVAWILLSFVISALGPANSIFDGSINSLIKVITRNFNRYIFSGLTLIPSLIIGIFSAFIFALNKQKKENAKKPGVDKKILSKNKFITIFTIISVGIASPIYFYFVILGIGMGCGFGGRGLLCALPFLTISVILAFLLLVHIFLGWIVATIYYKVKN